MLGSENLSRNLRRVRGLFSNETSDIPVMFGVLAGVASSFSSIAVYGDVLTNNPHFHETIINQAEGGTMALSSLVVGGIAGALAGRGLLRAKEAIIGNNSAYDFAEQSPQPQLLEHNDLQLNERALTPISH